MIMTMIIIYDGNSDDDDDDDDDDDGIGDGNGGGDDFYYTFLTYCRNAKCTLLYLLRHYIINRVIQIQLTF